MKKLKNKLWFFDSLVRFFALSADSQWHDNPIGTQQKILKDILQKNKHTFFGRKYAAETLKSYADFQAKIPLSSYDELFPYIERMIRGERNVLTAYDVVEYAKSSGTASGRSKYIPTPQAYLFGNHFKAGHDLLTAYARAHKNTRIFSGKAISIVGSIGKIPNSIFSAGDISALIMKHSPLWTAHSRPYKKSLIMHESWPHKAGKIVEGALNKNIVSLYGAPTWMLEVLELAQAKSGVAAVGELWENLEVFFHGAVSFVPYRERFKKLIGNSSVEFREVYNASEGVFAYEDNPIQHPGEMLLCTNHAIFYEFVRVEDCVPSGAPIELKDVVIGVHYALIITTTSGLWRYMVGDVVVFTSTAPYRLKIVGRTTQFLNTFGEEIVADNALHAIEEAGRAVGGAVQAFTASPTFDAEPSQGAHEWIVEFKTEPKERGGFAAALDSALRARNSDYDAKRASDIILGMPKVHIAPVGTFRNYMEGKGKLGGQNKVPLLSSDRTVLEALLKMF